jgi:hypothetical protein
MAVTVVIFSDHRAARRIQRGEQAGGALADVVMGHPGWGVGMMAKIGAVWPTPESGFFIDTQHQRDCRWIQVQTDDVANLVDELRIGR